MSLRIHMQAVRDQKEHIHISHSDDLTFYPLKILWYGRFHPEQHPLWTTILVPLNISICCLFMVLAIKGALVSHKEDIFYTAECLQTCILMIHAIGKFLSLYVHKNALAELLAQKSKFWEVHNTYEEKYNISITVTRIIRSYYYLNIFVCIFFDLQPFSTGSLPTKCHIPEGFFIYLTITLWYLSYMVLAGLPGTDCFFCSLATSLFIQLQLLGRELKKIAEPANLARATLESEFKKLVDFHNFLISYCEKLNSIFRSVFLLQFAVSIASVSVSIFIFMQPGDWTNRIKFLLYFIATIVQTAFYCVPLEFVANAATKVGQSIYESKWYDIKDTQLKKCLTVVIARSQKVVVFSAYGLIWINLRTFVVICKTAFSFYTYLNSVNKVK